MKETAGERLWRPFCKTLAKAYFAEKSFGVAVAEMAKNAKAPGFQLDLEKQRSFYEAQRSRVECAFALFDIKPRSQASAGVKGILLAIEDDLALFGGTQAIDAVYAGHVLMIVHQDIWRFGLLKAWAEQLNNMRAAVCLGDVLMSQIARKKQFELARFS